MYQDKIVLSPQDILEKEFKIDTRGYRLQEVDKFLDIIIRDYTEYNNIIKSMEEEIKVLSKDNQELKQEIRNLRDSAQVIKNSEREVTNVDLLRRISNLEKIILVKEQQ